MQDVHGGAFVNKKKSRDLHHDQCKGGLNIFCEVFNHYYQNNHNYSSVIHLFLEKNLPEKPLTPAQAVSRNGSSHPGGIFPSSQPDDLPPA